MTNIKAIDVFQSLSYVNFGYVEEADADIAQHTKRRLSKTARTLLIAAIIAALFTAVAYATGWFGLGSFLGKSNRVILNGMSGTPEAQATDEWFSFSDNYLNEQLEENGQVGDDRSWSTLNSEYAAAAAVYEVYDRAMADKLIEISHRYGLELHSWYSNSLTPEDFLDAAGAYNIICSDEAKICSGTIFEDGSFTCALELSNNESQIDRLSRYTSGKLMNWSNAVPDASQFEEWEYKNASGQTLCMAISATPQGDWKPWQYYIFYKQGDCYVSMFGQSEHTLDRKYVEDAADMIDFSACCSGKANVSPYRNYNRHIDETSPALTYDEFLATDEFKALSEFRLYYCETYGDYYSDGSGYAPRHYCPTEIREAVLGSGDADAERALKEIAESYSLIAPESMENLTQLSKHLKTNLLLEESENGDVLFEYLRQGRFYDGELNLYGLYDTGAFSVSGRAVCDFNLHYIPKGSLYINTWNSCFEPFDGGADAWMYETANGDRVCCVHTWPEDVIVYESEKAYIVVRAHESSPATGFIAPQNSASVEYRLEKLANAIKFNELK